MYNTNMQEKDEATQLGSDDAVAYWTKKLRRSGEELEKALAKAADTASSVRKFLGRARNS